VVFSPIRTITGTIGIEMGEVAGGSMHYHALFGLAFILLIITLIVNLSAVLTATGFTKQKNQRRGKKPLIKGRIIKYLCGFIALLILLLIANPVYAAVIVGSLLLVKKLLNHFNPKIIEKIAFTAITASALLVVAILGIILYYIIANGVPAISWEFLTEPPKNLGREGGIYPAIVGTIYLVVGAILLSLPLGVGAAIYFTEYTREGFLTKAMRAGSDLLNSTPSIVFGLFGFAFLVVYLKLGISMLAGQITLALMVLPTIVRTTEESLKNVPAEVRHGSLALGATKWQTIQKVVLPQAIPGILTGIILSIGRAAGETAPIMFTAVVFSQRFLPTSLTEPVMSLTYHLFILSTNVPGAEAKQYGTALILLLLVLGIYSVAILIRQRDTKREGW
jgi:phosphate transport system permease protein